MLTPEQVAATRKANLDILFGLGEKVVEGIEKLAALNMQVTRSTLGDTFDQLRSDSSRVNTGVARS